MRLPIGKRKLKMKLFKKNDLVYNLTYSQFAAVIQDQENGFGWTVRVVYLGDDSAYSHIRDNFRRAAISFGGPVALQSW